jgi:O-antigen/teichoic acid export membrane protein
VSKKSLIKNTFFVGVIQVVNYGFPIITIPIISRVIGPEKFGIINFSSAFVAYFVLLIGFGFELTATRKITSDPDNIENRNKVFSEVFISQCILLLFSTIVFSCLIFIVPNLRQEKEVAIFTFLTCFSVVMTQNWLFQAMQDLSKIALLNAISKAIYTIIILSVLRYKTDYIWQPLALSISQLIIGILSFVWALNKYKLKLYNMKFINCLKLLWDEKIFFLSLCTISLYTNTNIIVLGIFHNITEVGFYTAGQKVISIIQMMISLPLSLVLYPYIGRAFGESYEKGIDIVQKLIPIVLVFTLLVGISIFIGAPLIIEILYGTAFSPAVIVCRILAFIPMIIALGTVLGIHVMLNLKMDKVFLKVTIIGAFISVILNLILVNYLGYIGSAYTWAITEFINLSFLFYFLKKKNVIVLNIKYFKLVFLKQLLSDLKLNKQAFNKS